MKKVLTLLSIILVGSFVFSQKTMEYNGKTYYIYPHNVPVKGMPYFAKSYRSFVKQYKATYQQWIDEAKGKEKDKLIEEKEDRFQSYTQSSRGKRKINNWVEKCKNKQLQYLSSPQYIGLDELTPSLDPLPDGDYVQLFDPLVLGNNQGIDSHKVAGVFSIKNDALDGNGTWYYLNGDTLVHGAFNNGLKTGTWLDLSTRIKPNRGKSSKKNKTVELYFDIDHYLKRDVVLNYKNGLLHGERKVYFGTYFNSKHIQIESYYENGEPSGTWKEYEYDYRDERYRLVSNKTFADTNIFLVNGEHPIIRPSFYKRNFEVYKKIKKDYVVDEDSSMKYPVNFQFSALAQTLTKEVFENPELFEKKSQSLRYYRRNYFNSPKFYCYLYQDTVREWYPNGQLKWEAIIKDGHLEKEPDIFYDNGKVASEVRFNVDSNKYFVYEYLYNGELSNIEVHDTNGIFLYVDARFRDKKQAFIYHGEQLVKARNKLYYEIKNDKLPLEHNLKDTNYLALNVFVDTSVSLAKVFLPREHKYYEISTHYGDTTEFLQLQFDSLYTRFSGTRILTWKNISLFSTLNGTENEREKRIDTLPAYQFLDYGTLREYDITYDHKILINGEPFNGKVNVSLDNMKLKGSKIKLKNDLLEIRISDNKTFYARNRILNKSETMTPEAYEQMLFKEHKAYYNKKPDFNAVADIVKEIFEQINFSNSSEELAYYGYLRNENYSFTGNVENGKLVGRWNVKGSTGEIEKTYDFVKGEYHGQIISYNLVNKIDFYKQDKIYYDHLGNPVGKKLPNKYPFEVKNFENDLREGKYFKYDIHGNVLEEYNYENGLLHGPGFVKGDFFFIKENFNLGARDGRMEIFMTYNDTILMSDLNFQNGDLSGKSTIYHENGKVAKEGFFLDGKPIETYQAFDSTGQLYHYVKFKYGFATEEKIWEENQLSAKYDMDWEDSVYFNNFKFITNDDYVSKVLYNIGGMGRNYYKPYKGRPSMVEKEDIPYFLTKYYPDNTLAREGRINDMEEKIGNWNYYHYNGNKLYSIHYGDSIIKVNDSIEFKTYGKYYKVNTSGDTTMIGYITEMDSKYDCANTDHYEIRQFYFPNQLNDDKNLRNGTIKHYYDNGVLQSEGKMQNGIPTGVWKFYDPYGKLNQVGAYKNGQKEGRWLKGDLAKIKFLGDICLNPNMPNLEEEIAKREKELDVSVHYYMNGQLKNTIYFDMNLNKKRFDEGHEFDYSITPSF